MSEKVDLTLFKQNNVRVAGMPVTSTNPIKETEISIGSELSSQNSDDNILSLSNDKKEDITPTNPKLLEYGIDLDKPLVITKELAQKMKNKGKKGFWESLKDGAKNIVPFGSATYDMYKSIKILDLVKEMEEYGFDALSKEDKETIILFQLEQAEEANRGSSFAGKVATSLSYLPAFAGEFALTGGFYRMGATAAKAALSTSLKLAAQKVTEMGIKKAGAKATMSFATKAVAETVAGSVARSAVLSHRAYGNYAERRVDNNLAIDKDGLVVSATDENGKAKNIQTNKENKFLTAGKAVADNYIEVLSEQSGAMFSWGLTKPLGKVFKKIPATQKFLNPVPRAQKWMSEGGFHGLFEEYAEERFGGFLRGAINLDTDKDKTYLENLYHSTVPTWEQSGVELATTALWGGAMAGMSARKVERYKKAVDWMYYVQNKENMQTCIGIIISAKPIILGDTKQKLASAKEFISSVKTVSTTAHKSIPLDLKEDLFNIVDNDGIAISTADKSQANAVRNELALWQKLSADNQIILPLSINFINTPYMKNACINTFGNISITGSATNAKEATAILRHELIHANTDLKNEELAMQIMPRTQVETKYLAPFLLDIETQKISDVTNSKQKQTCIDIDNCKYMEELVKGGLGINLIQYAYTSPAEFIAVAMSGNTNAYSDEFKEFLLKIGAPKAAFELCKEEPAKMTQEKIDATIKLIKLDYKRRIQQDCGDKYLHNNKKPKSKIKQVLWKIMNFILHNGNKAPLLSYLEPNDATEYLEAHSDIFDNEEKFKIICELDTLNDNTPKYQNITSLYIAPILNFVKAKDYNFETLKQCLVKLDNLLGKQTFRLLITQDRINFTSLNEFMQQLDTIETEISKLTNLTPECLMQIADFYAEQVKTNKNYAPNTNTMLTFMKNVNALLNTNGTPNLPDITIDDAIQMANLLKHTEYADFQAKYVSKFSQNVTVNHSKIPNPSHAIIRSRGFYKDAKGQIHIMENRFLDDCISTLPINVVNPNSSEIGNKKLIAATTDTLINQKVVPANIYNYELKIPGVRFTKDGDKIEPSRLIGRYDAKTDTVIYEYFAEIGYHTEKLRQKWNMSTEDLKRNRKTYPVCKLL